jgi:hypothetical protein
LKKVIISIQFYKRKLLTQDFQQSLEFLPMDDIPLKNHGQSLFDDFRILLERRNTCNKSGYNPNDKDNKHLKGVATVRVRFALQ